MPLGNGGGHEVQSWPVAEEAGSTVGFRGGKGKGLKKGVRDGMKGRGVRCGRPGGLRKPRKSKKGVAGQGTTNEGA